MLGSYFGGGQRMIECVCVVPCWIATGMRGLLAVFPR